MIAPPRGFPIGVTHLLEALDQKILSELIQRLKGGKRGNIRIFALFGSFDQYVCALGSVHG